MKCDPARAVQVILVKRNELNPRIFFNLIEMLNLEDIASYLNRHHNITFLYDQNGRQTKIY